MATRSRCHIHNSSPSDPVRNQTNPALTLSLYFMIYFNITLQFTHKSFKWSISFKAPDQSSACICNFFHVCYIPHLSRPFIFDHPNKIWETAQIMKLLIKFSPSVLLLPLSLVQLFSITLFSNNHKLYSFINAGYQISHLHRTTNTTAVLYMLIFTFLTSSREEIYSESSGRKNYLPRNLVSFFSVNAIEIWWCSTSSEDIRVLPLLISRFCQFLGRGINIQTTYFSQCLPPDHPPY